MSNILHAVPYMLKHSDLFDELPESHHVHQGPLSSSYQAWIFFPAL